MTWIDVDDAMPDPEDTVLMFMPETEEARVWPGYFDYYGDGCWLLADGLPAGRVTHWMYFPLLPGAAK